MYDYKISSHMVHLRGPFQFFNASLLAFMQSGQISLYGLNLLRDHIRPHSSLGYRPPAPGVIISISVQVLDSVSLHLTPAHMKMAL